MSIGLFFDYLGVRLDGARAGDRRITLVCALPDTGETYTLLPRNGALSHRPGADEGADATVTIARTDLNDVILGAATLADQAAAGRATIEGETRALEEFLGLLDTFEFWFDIVTP